LKEQLLALAQVESHFDKANADIHHHIQESYQQLQKDLTNHHHSINAEKQQYEQEKQVIKGTLFDTN
jgi:uncharacterized membrane-anchored protein YhcB (DUF1043 family)